MGRTTTGRTSALLAVVACALVVCAALAAVPGGADAQDQQDLTGEVTFQESNGQLSVAVESATNGSFSGGNESVTIDVGGTDVERGPTAPEGGEYTYTVGQNRLADILGGQSGSDTPVRVLYGGTEVFNETVDIRRVALGNSGEFTDDGELRFDVRTTFGVESGAEIPIQVGGQDATATYDNATAPGLVVDRGTLGTLGVLREPGRITVSGGETYVRGEVGFDTATAPVTATRLSNASGVTFGSPLFEGGETYVVTASIDSSPGQYVGTADAGEQEIRVDSAALAAESSLTLTVEHESAGSTIYGGETVEFTAESVTGDVSADGAEITNISLPDGNYGDVWVRVGNGAEQYNATADVENETVELSDPDAVQWPDANQTGILIEREESPLYATVTLQSGTGGQGGGQGGSGLLGALPGGRFLLIGGGAVLGVVVVAAGVYAGLAVFGSGTTRLNPLGGSSKSKASAKSPPSETAEVSFEVVGELAGRTYREANRVVARSKAGGQAGFGGGGAVGSRGGRNAGGPAGVNTDTGQRIGLSGGTGTTELDYGDWVFEVEERNRTVGKRDHTLEYGFDSDHIALSVAPYAVSVQVTEGPERKPAETAEVSVTTDVERWSSRKRTDRDGRVQFEIPRSASRVTFTAEKSDLRPVESEHRIEQVVQDGVTLAIGAETGGMAIETRVGKRAWPGVEVLITPVSQDAKAYTDEGPVTTDSEGRREVQNLPVGEYEVSAHPQPDGVETTEAVERVTVRDNVMTEVAVSIGISYSIPETHRDRLAGLRERIEGLTAATNRDVAIPRYYGTVLTSVLDLVEAVESSPENVVGEGVPPDAMVEAVLDATDAGITAVEGAMSERRTSSLLEACASMPPAEVAWSGDATLDAFLEQATEGGERDRRALRDRLKETDDVLDEMWGEVNEIAPARKLHDRVGELARETGGIDDELTVVARAYVGICLLDAIEELFEHDDLRERLNSGSY